MPDQDGHPVTSPMGTQALWNLYPGTVRSWISQHGGLSRKMIYLEGSALGGIVANCDSGTQRVQARSNRRESTRACATPAQAPPATAANAIAA